MPYNTHIHNAPEIEKVKYIVLVNGKEKLGVLAQSANEAINYYLSTVGLKPYNVTAQRA